MHSAPDKKDTEMNAILTSAVAKLAAIAAAAAVGILLGAGSSTASPPHHLSPHHGTQLAPCRPQFISAGANESPDTHACRIPSPLV